MVKRTRLPYTQQKRGRWYFVRRQGGKIAWKALGGDPATDADAMRLYHRLKAGMPAEPPKPKNTVGSVIDSYMASTRWPAKASTQSSYRRILRSIREKNGDQDIRRFTRPSIITIRDKVAARSTREADHIVTMFSLLFEHAIDKGLRADNPAKGVSRVNKAREHQPWPQWAVDGFRREADPLTRTIFELCLGTAQRLSDVLAMRWDDIEDGGINVVQQKTGAALWVPMTETLAAYLAGMPRSLTTIAADGQGKPLDRHRAQKLLAAVRPSYGGEAFTWHGLRYNAVAEIGDKPDEVIGAISGHRSPAMVKKYAGKGRQRRLAKEARKR